MAKGRPRFSRRNGTARTPEKTKDYEARVRSVASYEALRAHAAPIEGPVEMQITLLMPRPKSATKKELACRFHIKKPDADNIEKILMDACNGIAYIDDSQVCIKKTIKRYAEAEKAGVGVWIGKAE